MVPLRCQLGHERPLTPPEQRRWFVRRQAVSRTDPREYRFRVLNAAIGFDVARLVGVRAAKSPKVHAIRLQALLQERFHERSTLVIGGFSCTHRNVVKVVVAVGATEQVKDGNRRPRASMQKQNRFQRRSRCCCCIRGGSMLHWVVSADLEELPLWHYRSPFCCAVFVPCCLYAGVRQPLLGMGGRRTQSNRIDLLMMVWFVIQSRINLS